MSPADYLRLAAQQLDNARVAQNHENLIRIMRLVAETMIEEADNLEKKK